nr:carotenoid oxygenase family protein [Candidatus Frankia alpina]
MTASTPTYLSGLLAPVADEIDVVDLPITGALPDALRGRYFRNGPNPPPPAPTRGTGSPEPG